MDNETRPTEPFDEACAKYRILKLYLPTDLLKSFQQEADRRLTNMHNLLRHRLTEYVDGVLDVDVDEKKGEFISLRVGPQVYSRLHRRANTHCISKTELCRIVLSEVDIAPVEKILARNKMHEENKQNLFPIVANESLSGSEAYYLDKSTLEPSAPLVSYYEEERILPVIGSGGGAYVDGTVKLPVPNPMADKPIPKCTCGILLDECPVHPDEEQ